jgi:hypothetical protein
MKVAQHRVVDHRRERMIGEVVTLAGLLVMLAVAAIAGGAMMMADPSGESLGLETAMLEEVPLVGDYLIPGVLLFALLGLAPLLVAAGLFGLRLPGVERFERRLGYRWPLLASVAQGAIVVAWILLQYLWLPETAPVQWVTLVVGIGILIFSLLPGVRRRYAVD